MQKKDYYQILELTEEDKKLSQDEFVKKVRGNYRNLAKRFHPDKFANKPESEKKEAEEKFKEISEAYDILSNPEKKQKYDTYGTVDGFDFSGFRETGMDDIDEILRRFHGGGFGSFGFGFEDMNPFHRQYSQNRIQKPAPLRIKLHVSIEDIYNGTSKKVRYKHMVPCEHCGGNGFGEGGKVETCPVCGGSGMQMRVERRGFTVIQEGVPCSNCHGTGQVMTNACKHCNGSGRIVGTDELVINIPAGVVNGSSFVLEGKGNCAERNKDIVGDLIVLIEVEQSNRFQIANQYDLYTLVEIPILDCLVGCKIEVAIFGNTKAVVEIPKLTSDGTILKVKGKGMLMDNRGNRGNFLVRIKHKLPKSLSKSDEKLIAQLKESKNFK